MSCSLLRVACVTAFLGLLPTASHAELSDTCFGYEATFTDGAFTGTIHFHPGQTAIVSIDDEDVIFQGIWSQTPANSPINSIFSRWTVELPSVDGSQTLQGIVLFEMFLIGEWNIAGEAATGDLSGFVQDCDPTSPPPPAPRP